MNTFIKRRVATTTRRIAPAFGLFFLSPLVAEFLLGNIAIDAIWTGLFFAPLYGGGAVLIREVTRRTGRGWPTMLMLALAYAVIEEGLVTQSLFNPSYFGFDLLGPTHIPLLGIGAWWTIYVLTLHTVWSIAVPIALVEGFVLNRNTTPWLGKPGLAVIGALFLLGAIVNYSLTNDQEGFVASTQQRLGTIVVVLALIVAAFAIGRRPPPDVDRLAPNPWVVGVVSLLASSFFTLGLYLPSWATVGVWLVSFAGIAVLVTRWSRRVGWGASHELALAGGALLTYAWQGFPHTPIIGTTGAVDLIGNTVFAVGAVIVLAIAGLNQHRRKEP
ncbi:MAG: hypothetical protein KF689_14295 [Gemmatimonadaceae bacterium]|nr:hypothetical protein [Gemmatimonadaceae bacterium]MCW5826842.1 hypothetical protein [Gemmatimonadaceae bacterium]